MENDESNLQPPTMEAHSSTNVVSPSPSLPILTPNFEVPSWRINEDFWDFSSGSTETNMQTGFVQRSLETPPPPFLTLAVDNSQPPTLSAEFETTAPEPEAHSTSRSPASKRPKRGSTVQKEKPNPRRKNLTPNRKEILKKFLWDIYAQPYQYGDIGGEQWTSELIKRLRKFNGSTGNVTRMDVLSWLQFPEIKSLLNRIQGAASQPMNEVGEHLNDLSLSMPEATPSSSRIQINSPTTEGDAVMTEIKAENEAINYMPSAQMTNAEGSQGPSISYSASELPGTSNATGINMGHGFSANNRSLSPASFSDVFAELGSMEFPTEAASSQPQPQQQQQYQNQSLVPLSSELEIYTQSSGFVIRVPPSSTTTVVYMKPSAFKVYKHHPSLETEAGSSSILTNSQQQPQTSGQFAHASTPMNVPSGNPGVIWTFGQGTELP